MIREARERAEREYQADLERRRQAFQQSPTEHLRSLGDPQQIVDAVLKENTPEARALAALQRELAETKKQAGGASEAKAEIEALRKQVAAAEQQRRIDEIRGVFLGNHATKEKAPYAYAEHGGPDGVFAAADRKAVEWQKQGLQLGTDFDFDDVASYIEREAKSTLEQKLKALNLTPAQQSGAGAPPGPGIAPKSAANGTRTLSAAQGSERRTTPKPLSEMSEEESRKALIEEVAAARRANPDSPF